MFAASHLSPFDYETDKKTTSLFEGESEEFKDSESAQAKEEIDDVESDSQQNMSNTKKQQRTFLFVCRAKEKYFEGGGMEITWDMESNSNTKDQKLERSTSADLTIATLISDHSLDHCDYAYEDAGRTIETASFGSNSILKDYNGSDDSDTAIPKMISLNDNYESSSDNTSMSILDENKNSNINSLEITAVNNDDNDTPSTTLGKSSAGNNIVTDDSSFASSTRTKHLQPEYLLPQPIMERLLSLFNCGETTYYDEDAQRHLTVANLLSDYPLNHYKYGNNHDHDNDSSCSSINMVSFSRNRNSGDYYNDEDNDTSNATVLSFDDDYKISLDGLLMNIMEEYKDQNAYSQVITTTHDHDDGDDGDDDDRLPLKILGISSGENSLISSVEQNNLHRQCYVLSPPTMERLRPFFPYSKRNDNFWLKYSLVRDGASMHTFLEKARGAKHSIIAVETIDGEVFGSFTSEPWRKTWSSLGNGESFLWKMKHPRDEETTKNLRQQSRSNRRSLIMDIIRKESEIDVYPYTGESGNDIIQICNPDKIAVGGGTGVAIRHTSFCEKNKSNSSNGEGGPCQQDQQPLQTQQQPRYGYGYGLHIQKDMSHGTTSCCIPFSSPSLSRKHADGSLFEIRNLELWSLTPCMSEKDAEQVERIGLVFMK